MSEPTAQSLQGSPDGNGRPPDSLPVWFYLLQVVVPLCCVGLVGNVLVVVVMLRKRFRSLSTSAYLVYLAAADTGCLLLALSGYTLHMAELTNYTYTHKALCKTNILLSTLFSLFSSWTLVVISIERVFVVGKPILARIKCKPCWAWSYGGALFGVVLLVSLGMTFLGDKSCIPINDTLSLFNILLYSAIPGLLVAVCSGIICCVVYWHYNHNVWRFLRQADASKDNLTRLSAMLALRVVFFILLTLPNTLFMPIKHLLATQNPDPCAAMADPIAATTVLSPMTDSGPTTPGPCATMADPQRNEVEERILTMTLNVVFHLLALLNHSLNPLLYTFCGSLFREELCKIFGCAHQESPSSSKRTSERVMSNIISKATSERAIQTFTQVLQKGT